MDQEAFEVCNVGGVGSMTQAIVMFSLAGFFVGTMVGKCLGEREPWVTGVFTGMAVGLIMGGIAVLEKAA